MKQTIKVTEEKEIEVTHVEICVKVDQGIEEDLPENFPMKEGELLKISASMDGKIISGPKNADIYIKVCDGGIYSLFNGLNRIARIKDNYVPHGVIPGEYGDYIELNIENGIITNWPKHPDISAFFKREKD